MININKTIIVGHLGKKPELKKTNNNKSYCFLSIGTSEVWYKEVDGQKQKQERTDFHTVKVWGVDAENCCKWLEKGQQVGVEGANRCDLIKGQNGKGDTWFRYIQAFPRGVDFGYKSMASQKRAAEQAGQAPVNTPAPTNKQPTIGELMQQMAQIQKMVLGLTGAAAAAPSAQPEFIPPEEADYSAGPYDNEPAAPPQQQPRILAGL